MRITIYSNAPWSPTGYGTQTAQLTERLVTDGHDVVIVANYGLQAAVREWQGVPVFPGGPDGYATWNAAAIHEMHRGDLLLTLYDTFVLDESVFAGIKRIASWTPVDSIPLPAASLAWAKRHDNIAMSRFGERVFAAAGLRSTYIPHAIERVYQPVASDIRERMEVPEDAFLVTINAANKGIPPRKAWVQMLDAFQDFSAKHKDVYLYLHTDATYPSGVHLVNWSRMLGIPDDRLRIADQTVYRIAGANSEEMAQVYSSSDVLLATSMGEGFGIPVIEAMACGTPAIVTDFSAQPELVGDTGWKVPWQKDVAWDRGTVMAMPLTLGILRALEAAYAERGTDAARARSEAAIVKAAEYDADRVFAEHWRPLLARLERDLHPSERPGNTKAAKRRARKMA